MQEKSADANHLEKFPSAVSELSSREFLPVKDEVRQKWFNMTDVPESITLQRPQTGHGMYSLLSGCRLFTRFQPDFLKACQLALSRADAIAGVPTRLQ